MRKPIQGSFPFGKLRARMTAKDMQWQWPVLVQEQLQIPTG